MLRTSHRHVALAALITTAPLGCATNAGPTAAEREANAVAAISPTRLKGHIDVLADDALAGRICGSPGHDTARDYVRDQLAAAGVTPFGDDGGFLHGYAAVPFDGYFQRQADGTIVPNATDRCHNVVGLLRGSDRADEFVVLVAHYDHLGVTESGEVFNGAFDDGSGTAALLEVARAMVAEGVKPRRSIVFLISDQEEQGLVGAGAWLDATSIPRDHIVAGFAVDPVGRGLLPDYAPIVLSGAERSTGLGEFLRGTQPLTDHPLGFIHRMMIPIFGSDHDQFFDHGIPAVWLISPGMTFYHQVTDDPETIDYAVLRDVSRYILRIALSLANSDTRFTYTGEAPLDLGHAQDTKDLLLGVLTSKVISDDERKQVEGYVADLDEVLASNWDAVGAPLAFFANALGLVAFSLPRLHPGDIPPAFPNDPNAPYTPFP